MSPKGETLAILAQERRRPAPPGGDLWAANGRYLEALASVRAGESARAVAQRVCRPIVRDGRRHRSLNPWGEADAALLAVLSRGEWTV